MEVLELYRYDYDLNKNERTVTIRTIEYERLSLLVPWIFDWVWSNHYQWRPKPKGYTILEPYKI